MLFGYFYIVYRNGEKNSYLVKVENSFFKKNAVLDNVVGGIVGPQDVCVLIPGTCECVQFHCKRELRL